MSGKPAYWVRGGSKTESTTANVLARRPTARQSSRKKGFGRRIASPSGVSRLNLETHDVWAAGVRAERQAVGSRQKGRRIPKRASALFAGKLPAGTTNGDEVVTTRIPLHDYDGVCAKPAMFR